LLLSTIVVAAACSSGYSAPGATPAPAAPGAAAPAPSAKALQLLPGTTRYLVHQDVHIQQDFTGLPPTIDLRFGLYLTTTIAAPADSLGYPTTFTVDSIKVDSGIQLPPQINLAAARGYRVTGRLSATGEFTNPVASDSGAAASLGISSPVSGVSSRAYRWAACGRAIPGPILPPRRTPRAARRSRVGH